MFMNQFFIKVLSLVSILFFVGCIEQPNSFSSLPPGEWRGILKLSDPDQILPQGLLDEEQKVLDFFELPFNMKVKYEGEDMKIFLLNGTEEIEVETVHYGRDPSTAKDTIQMKMEAFDTSLDAFYEDNFIEGYWVVNYKENYKIPFIAIYGQNHRFINRTVADTKDFSGKWKVTFEYDNDNAYPAVAEFKQDGNKLSGTFLTETGDYRFLDGNAYDDKMRLSVFDGAHAFLFSGTLEQDTIYGEFRSGKHYKSKWIATKENDFFLTDPYEMTKLTSSAAINFSFPDQNGKAVSLTDDQFQGKVKLINILGTWCPNCKDEIEFLKQVKTKNAEQIEVITMVLPHRSLLHSKKTLTLLGLLRMVMT